MGSDDKIYQNCSPVLRFVYYVGDLIDKPVTWVRKTVVEPNRQEYHWYHEKLRRVPTIDECYSDDLVCITEAEEQYKRDKEVEKNILHILKKRYEQCSAENEGETELCRPVFEYYENAVNNYFIKYGDLGIRTSAIYAFMKQKHRMAWERRHGPVGSGKKSKNDELSFKANNC